MRLLALLVACGQSVPSVCVPPMESQRVAPSARVPEKVEAIARGFSGRLGLAAVHLESGRTILRNADEPFQTASVIKVPIMVEAFYQVREGRIKLEDILSFTEADRVPGSGILQDLTPGIPLRFIDAITLMIVLSDNLATNLVIDRVGIDRVNARMASLGLKQTKLFKKVFLPAQEPMSQEARKFGLGMTTPREMMLLMQRLAQGEAVDRASCDRMIQILKKQRDRDQIPRYLSQLDLGGKVEVAHKTGALDAVRNDLAIVYTPKGQVVLSIFCRDSKDRRWSPENEASLAIARIAAETVRELLLTSDAGVTSPKTSP